MWSYMLQWKKTCEANPTSDKGIMPKMYKEIKKLNTTEPNYPIRNEI